MEKKLNFLDGPTKLKVCDHLRNGVEKYLPFSSWESAENYFTRYVGHVVTKANLQYCVKMVGDEIELVKSKRKSPLASVLERIDAIEARLAAIEAKNASY